MPSSSSDILRHSMNIERVRSLEQQVRALKGHLDVARSKERVATDAEAFVLESVRDVNKDLESE